MSRTNSWGYLRNGTFDGMIGALVRREVDIGGSPIFFREERARVIDVTARTWIARLKENIVNVLTAKLRVCICPCLFIFLPFT